MSARSRAREIALQILFQYEWNSRYSIDQAVQEYVNGLAVHDDHAAPDNAYTMDFARRCISGVMDHKSDIDVILARHARKWSIDRMAGVDRNILRLGIYELVYAPDIPARVAVNEAVELAKRFGADDSGAFVNGILDSVLKTEKNAESGNMTEGSNNHEI